MMNRNKLTILVLLGSLALNLLLVGGMSSRLLNRPDDASERGRQLRPLPPGIGWILRDLPEERRSDFAAFLEQSAAELNSARSEMFDAMRRANELMNSAEFDPDDLSAAFAELRDANTRYQVLSHEETVQLLSQLTESERQVATEFIQRRGPRGEARRRQLERRPARN